VGASDLEVVVAESEEEVPAQDEWIMVQEKRAEFYQFLDWKGNGEDITREVKSPKSGQTST
jgi:hypothetical protein